MFGGNGLSLADIAAVTNNRNDDGYGFGGGWWAWILIFALFGGWGGFGGFGGWGMNGMNGGAYGVEASLQRGFDTQTIIGKLDGISNGICNLGYDQLAQMNGIQNTVMQTGFGITQAINADTVANMQNTNALSSQLANCCCDNRAAIKDLQYNLATQSCATNNLVHQTGDAIIQNQNQGFQMLNNTIRDGFCNLEMRELARDNQNLRDRLNACDRDSALLAQSNYLINTLQPVAKPSYLTCNPNTGSFWPIGWQNDCNCNNGCWNTCRTCS